MRLQPTPSQTVGPFFSFALLDGAIGARLVEPDTQGAVRIEGCVLDGAGSPVTDAVLEIWQAGDKAGFTSLGRCGTDDEGRYGFVTLKPRRVPFADGRLQAPHIDVAVLARGLLKPLLTRMYFPDEEPANSVDPVLGALPPRARSTLVAHAVSGGLQFDVRLQGTDQTAFFAL